MLDAGCRMWNAVCRCCIKDAAQNRVKRAKRAPVEHEAKLRVALTTKTSCGCKLSRCGELNILHFSYRTTLGENICILE